MDRLRNKLVKILKERNDTNIEKLSNIDGNEISTVIREMMNHTEIAQIVHWTLMAIGSSQDKRLMVIENILKDLQVRNMMATRRSAIVSEITLEIGKFSPNELVALTSFCIETITQDKDEHKSWKDLLPKLLSVVVEKEEVMVSGTPKTGEDYKIDVIHTLCMGNWESKSLASMASMFIDVPMKPEEHLQVINKLCSAISGLVTSELPPLVHELLRLCKNGNSIILFVCLQEYFSQLLYAPVNSQQNSFDDISDDARSTTQAKPAESTILFYINQSANMGHSSIKDLIKSVTKLRFSPEKVFEPFLLTVLLSITNISAFKDQVLEILKKTIVILVSEEEKRSKSAWIRSNTPDECDFNEVIDAVIRCSIRERESVIKGLITLAFALLSIPVSMKMKELMAERLWRHGNHIIVSLLKKQSEELGATVLNQISISIRLRQAVKQHIACLREISTSSRSAIMQNSAIITSLMEHVVYMEENTGLDLVIALLPGIRHYKHLRDSIIVILRKALYSSTVETRVVAATSFLLLLKHFKVTSMGVLSQSSQGSNICDRDTQSILENGSQFPSASFGQDSICLEILGVLRRCLMQQAEVKEALFSALSNSVSENPELLSYVEDILANHLAMYFVENEAVLPPLDFSKVVVVKDVNVVLKEPLAHLIFACQQVVTQDSSRTLSKSGVKLQEMLGSLADRVVKCTLEELKLTDATELLDPLPENCQKQETVKQMLGVYEALMAYMLSSWSLDTPDHGRKLVSLFKSYNRLVEFCKLTSKAKKNDGNDMGDKRAKNMKSQSETKKKVGTGKAILFKLPSSLWDYPTTLKMLELIYEDSVDWCSEDVSNQTKSHRELRRYAVMVASQLVKLPHTKKRFQEDPESFVRLTNLLYQKVIRKLLDEVEYDHAVALTAVECFTDLLTLTSALPADKTRLKFISQVANTKASPLTAMVTTYQRRLTDVLSQDEDKDEPGSRRLPQLLVSGLSILVSLLPSDSPDLTEAYEWVKELATDTPIANDQVANGILELLLGLQIRCKALGTVFDNVALQLRSIIGTHLVEEGNKQFTKLAIVTKSTQNGALLLLCSALTDILQEAQWMVSRFHSEYAALSHPGKQTFDERRKALKAKERSACLHISYTINVVIYLCGIDLHNLPTPLMTLLRLLSSLYINITSLTRYFLLRSTKLQPAFRDAKFENLVKLCGKELSRSVNDFIVHIENAQDKGKKKDVDPLVLKMRVMREEKMIPKVTFEKEAFEKWLIKLSNKTKIDLMEHMKASGARDFRIKRSKLKSGLRRLNNTMDTSTTTESEVNPQSSEEEKTSDQEPKRKKKRSSP